MRKFTRSRVSKAWRGGAEIKWCAQGYMFGRDRINHSLREPFSWGCRTSPGIELSEISFSPSPAFIWNFFLGLLIWIYRSQGSSECLLFFVFFFGSSYLNEKIHPNQHKIAHKKHTALLYRIPSPEVSVWKTHEEQELLHGLYEIMYLY